MGLGFGNLPQLPPSSRYEGNFVGSVPLLDVVRLANWRIARLNHEISEWSFDAVVEDVLNSTAAAFFTHLRNLKRVDVIDANIARDEDLLGLARNQLQAGVATRIDVTRGEVQLAGDQKERIQQDTLVVESSLRLKLLLDLDLNEELTLVGLDLVKAIPSHALSVQLQALLDARPDFQLALIELKRNQVARRFSGLERLPTINAFGEWGYVSSEIFDDDESNAWLVGVALTLPVFEGFRIRSNIRRADALVRSQELAIRDLEQRIGASYLFSIQDVDSRFRQIAIATKKVELNEEELKLARTRFSEGVADNREIIDAQAALAESTDELVEAVYQYNLSRLELAKVRGDVRLVLTE